MFSICTNKNPLRTPTIISTFYNFPQIISFVCQNAKPSSNLFCFSLSLPSVFWTLHMFFSSIIIGTEKVGDVVIKWKFLKKTIFLFKKLFNYLVILFLISAGMGSSLVMFWMTNHYFLSFMFNLSLFFLNFNKIFCLIH